jgi:hypothetical protein
MTELVDVIVCAVLGKIPSFCRDFPFFAMPSSVSFAGRDTNL